MPERHKLEAQRLLQGDRRTLARAITLVESSRPDHRSAALGLLERLAPHAGGAIRVGISGAPGAGKSTYIEALGNHILDQGLTLAVLAVDPSSALSGGSILGDKTRMQRLACRQQAFIRPSPAGGTLGGVARRSRETLLLCEAAGFDVVLVETVGVGQSETAVAQMTDLFVLLLSPGSGDELQGIKRGIMELADLLLVNKADGQQHTSAQQTAADYRHALGLMHPRTPGWQVPVLTCSALESQGIAASWETILQCHQHQRTQGILQQRRADQARASLWNEATDRLLGLLRHNPRIRSRLDQLEQAVAAQTLPPSLAAEQLLTAFLENPS